MLKRGEVKGYMGLSPQLDAARDRTSVGIGRPETRDGPDVRSGSGVHRISFVVGALDVRRGSVVRSFVTVQTSGSHRSSVDLVRACIGRTSGGFGRP